MPSITSIIRQTAARSCVGNTNKGTEPQARAEASRPTMKRRRQ
ncbi:MAG: hypothetical protein QM749_13960 [Aquabacterium sp.]